MIERGEEDFVPEHDGREAGVVGKIRGLGSGRDDAALPQDTWPERESTAVCLRLHSTHLHPVHLDRCIAQGATLLLNFSSISRSGSHRMQGSRFSLQGRECNSQKWQRINLGASIHFQ